MIITENRELLDKFLEKLKNKPVYNTIKHLDLESDLDVFTVLKFLYSLSTHLCIEISHGNHEYKQMLAELHAITTVLIINAKLGNTK